MILWLTTSHHLVLFGDTVATHPRTPIWMYLNVLLNKFFSPPQVDRNVSRHLTDDFLRRSDWDFTILHFLGLDHIGHLAGPSSPLIGPKLDEMGHVIRSIKESLFEKSKNADNELPPLILVLGDHGMADVGGHGGASPAEILVPVVAISPNINLSEVSETASAYWQTYEISRF